MPTFTHRGINFNFELVGSGRPLVLCHGLTGDLSAPKELIGALPGYQIVVYDARAHGQTTPLGDVDDLRFSRMADDLRALLDHLGIDRAVVGGISMGAGVATRYAIDHPERVDGLVLIRPAWLDSPFPPNLDLPVLVARLFEEHGPTQWKAAFEQHPLVQEIQTIEPQLTETMRQQLDSPLAVERRARLMRIPGDCPIQCWTEVASLNLPAIVIGTHKDWLHPYGIAEAWASRIPNARLREVATKSIDPLAHARDVRRLVKVFLAECDSLR